MSDEVTGLIVSRLSARGDGDLAHAVRYGDEAYRKLSEGRKADLDAYLYGCGFLVDGERIDPRRVRVVPARERNEQ